MKKIKRPKWAKRIKNALWALRGKPAQHMELVVGVEAKLCKECELYQTNNINRGPYLKTTTHKVHTITAEYTTYIAEPDEAARGFLIEDLADTLLRQGYIDIVAAKGPDRCHYRATVQVVRPEKKEGEQ